MSVSGRRRAWLPGIPGSRFRAAAMLGLASVASGHAGVTQITLFVACVSVTPPFTACCHWRAGITRPRAKCETQRTPIGTARFHNAPSEIVPGGGVVASRYPLAPQMMKSLAKIRVTVLELGWRKSWLAMVLAVATLAGCSTYKQFDEPERVTEAEPLAEATPEVVPEVTREVPAERTRVAILLTAEIQNYQAIADEILARGPHNDYATFSLTGGQPTEADLAAIRQFGPDRLVAIGLAAAKAGRQFESTPMVFCQVFNYREHDLLSSESKGVKLLPPFDLQLEAWQKASPDLRAIGVVTGPDQQELTAEIQQAADARGIELLTRSVFSDKEMLNAFKRLTPQIQGFWLLPDNRVLSPGVLREIFAYARKRGIQTAVFNPQLLDFGADISFTSHEADVADAVLQVLGDAGPSGPLLGPPLTSLSSVSTQLGARLSGPDGMQASARKIAD